MLCCTKHCIVHDYDTLLWRGEEKEMEKKEKLCPSKNFIFLFPYPCNLLYFNPGRICVVVMTQNCKN